MDTTPLSITERHNEIINILMRRGSTSVTRLAKLLNVSEVTIRKDLTHLEEQKKLYRTHGKAILINPYISDRHVNEKEKQNVNEKMAIGLKAAKSVSDNDSIIIASGTTMMFFAHQLQKQNKTVTIVTSSTQVTSSLSQNPNMSIFQLGGLVRKSSISVVGNYAESILPTFHCSKLFLGVDGVDVDFGMTTTNVMEANLNRAMMKAAQRVVVLADSTKFGRRGFSKICDIKKVHEIITDSGIPSMVKRQLEDSGVIVTVVDI